MSQGGYVTLVGFVAREPIMRQTKEGTMVTGVRVGATTRVLDKTTGEWRDSDTSYFNVNCWRRLAGHAKASLHKGDPVMVKGRFRTRSYEDKTGRLRTEVEIVADTFGHDLSRGVANYLRIRTQPTEVGQPAADGTQSEGSSDNAAVGRFIDEEAIEQFGRELDAGLDEDELAAQALADDESDDESDDEGDEHEAAGTTGSPGFPEVSAPF